VYREYGKLLETAARTFKDTNGRKFKYKVDTIKAGDEEFQKQFKEVIAKITKESVDKSHKFNAAHGLIFPIENLGSIVFDFQKNSVVFNGNKFIPFKDLKDYSFMKDGTQISFDVPMGFYIE
jgi:archaellum component FlaF (FlaF/FlaG flagellin family)